MDFHAWIAIATLIVAMILFISKLIPLEATALSIPVILAVTGTVSPAEAALRGFGNNAVVALAAILSGTLTLISTTPNLILGSELARISGGERTLGMFEFTIVGVPICVTGIIYMALIGSKLLSRVKTSDGLKDRNFRERLLQRYRPEKRVFKFKVTSGSILNKNTIAEVGFGNQYQVDVLQVGRVKRFRRQFLDVQPDLEIKTEDILYIGGTEKNVNDLAKDNQLSVEPASVDEIELILGRGVGAAEVTISPTLNSLTRLWLIFTFERYLAFRSLLSSDAEDLLKRT